MFLFCVLDDITRVLKAEGKIHHKDSTLLKVCKTEKS